MAAGDRPLRVTLERAPVRLSGEGADRRPGNSNIPVPMTASGALLSSLETIAHETTLMADALDDAKGLPASERHEAKRRVMEIRGLAQELIEWISAARLEEPRN